MNTKKFLKLALVALGLSLSQPVLSWAQSTTSTTGTTSGTANAGPRHHHHFKLMKACLAQQGITPPTPAVGQRLPFSSLDEKTQDAMQTCHQTISQGMQSCLGTSEILKNAGVTVPTSREGWQQLPPQQRQVVHEAKKSCRAQILATFSS